MYKSKDELIKEQKNKIYEISNNISKLEERIEIMKVLADDENNKLAYITRDELDNQMEILKNTKDMLLEAEILLRKIKHSDIKLIKYRGNKEL